MMLQCMATLKPHSFESVGGVEKEIHRLSLVSRATMDGRARGYTKRIQVVAHVPCIRTQLYLHVLVRPTA